MNKPPNPFTLHTITSMRDISKQDWNQFAGTSKTLTTTVHNGTDLSRLSPQTAYNPFISYDFLYSLEVSGSIGVSRGWISQHLILSNSEGNIVGALPAYIKSHSQGEYVFDHGWADAWERAGGQYYPKLQCSIPYTPVTGPRFLVHQKQNRMTIMSGLASALCQLTRQLQLSSAHITFMPEDESRISRPQGFLIRHDQQFHFYNDRYESYDAFLEHLTSRKRKALRKERRMAHENDITIDWLTGSQLTEEIWDIFYRFYINTSTRKWGRPYLTRAFFSLISQYMANDILLIMAKRDGHYIAGAIHFIGTDCLYGRHWGCVEYYPYLHFELCYHQAIDFAIKHGLSRIEAGAQGQHKMARGYLPATTYSAHYILDPNFRRAISDYLNYERKEIKDIQQALKTHAPFKI